MVSTSPRPFTTALRWAGERGILPTTLSSADLATLAPEIRQAAVFSAGVTEVEVLQLLHDRIARLVSGVSAGPGQGDP